MVTAHDTTPHTAAEDNHANGPQLDGAHAAMPDLLCWIYAAVPLNPRTGRPDIPKVARILQVDPATVYRWIRTADDREFGPDATALLRNRAQLRGHGDIWWPGIDQATATRHDTQLTTALAARAHMTRTPDSAAAAKARRPTQVITYYNDAARVFGIITASSSTNRNRLLARQAGNTLVDQVTVPDTFTATIIKYTVLQMMGDDRCIAPEVLLRKGRTEVWRRVHHDRTTGVRYTTDIDLRQITTALLDH